MTTPDALRTPFEKLSFMDRRAFLGALLTTVAAAVVPLPIGLSRLNDEVAVQLKGKHFFIDLTRQEITSWNRDGSSWEVALSPNDFPALLERIQPGSSVYVRGPGAVPIPRSDDGSIEIKTKGQVVFHGVEFAEPEA